MSQFNPFTFIAIGVLIFVVVIVLFQLITFMTTRRWNRHKAETVDKWAAEGIKFIRGPKGIQFGGLASMGASRVVYSLGFAVLTSQDIRLTQASPSAVWIIPFKQIKKITIERAFMGKQSKKTPFIVVQFAKDDQTDKVAFQVQDFMVWARALAKAAKVRIQDTTKNN